MKFGLLDQPIFISLGWVYISIASSKVLIWFFKYFIIKILYYKDFYPYHVTCDNIISNHIKHRIKLWVPLSFLFLFKSLISLLGFLFFLFSLFLFSFSKFDFYVAAKYNLLPKLDLIYFLHSSLSLLTFFWYPTQLKRIVNYIGSESGYRCIKLLKKINFKTAGGNNQNKHLFWNLWMLALAFDCWCMWNWIFLKKCWKYREIIKTKKCLKCIDFNVVKTLRMRDSYTNLSESIEIKSFEIFGLTNWIYDTNLLKTGLWIESTKQIFWTL